MSDGLRREVLPIVGDRGAWLAARRGLITASIGAALFDRHPFISREQLAGILRGENQGDNAAMRRGRILESAVAAAVEEEYPHWAPLQKNGNFYTFPDLRIGATPDYLVSRALAAEAAARRHGVINIQCKTVNQHTFDQTWRGIPPLGYKIQVLIENLLMDSLTGYLAVLVTSSGYPLHVWEVPRHAAVEQMFLDAAAAWFREHDAGRLPSAAPSEEIAAAYEDGSHIDLSGDNLLPALLEERARLKAGTSEAEARLKEIDDTLRERVGAARSAWLPGWLIRLPSITARAYSVPERTYRRLDVRPTKEDDAA